MLVSLGTKSNHSKCKELVVYSVQRMSCPIAQG